MNQEFNNTFCNYESGLTRTRQTCSNFEQIARPRMRPIRRLYIRSKDLSKPHLGLPQLQNMGVKDAGQGYELDERHRSLYYLYSVHAFQVSEMN